MAEDGAALYTAAMSEPSPPRQDIALPAPVLITGPAAALVREADGAFTDLSLREAAARAKSEPLVVCHMPAAARRLGLASFTALDVLELFAFVRPARFCLPTPRGIARVLGIAAGPGHGGEAEALGQAAVMLLSELAEAAAEPSANGAPGAGAELEELARLMAAGGWPWGEAVLRALGLDAEAAIGGAGALACWRDLPEWAEEAPEPPPGHHGVAEDAARARLQALVGAGGEARPQQGDYAAALTHAFQPRAAPGRPNMILAEAETGTGKTLGYIAPASLWAEANGGAVWISTFTRNLQRQIDQELDRLYPDPAVKAAKAVVRKGRENYLCLLNYEDAASAAGLNPREGAALGLMARWVGATRDGDMVGGDFPAWLTELLGRPRTLGLADRRGECIYAACAHYHKCFIERTVRRARRAEIVIANHALVLAQAALSGLDDAFVPQRYVFDEGHHLFAAADSAFAAALTGLEAAELRRWLAGAEDRRRSRARGLERRIGDVAAMDEDARRALDEVLRAAQRLPGGGWMQRLAEGAPRGPCEAFLARARAQVLARAEGAENDQGYGLETETRPLGDGVLAAASRLEAALGEIIEPLGRLAGRLARMLDAEADRLDAATRLRIEGALRAIDRRAAQPVGAWQAMLAALAEETPEDFVDWFAVDRVQGREIDTGLHRHWVDPTKPLADAVLAQAHGVVVTSATLTDSTGDAETDWRAAEERTGARHVGDAAAGEVDDGRPAVLRARYPSPFDYAAQARVLIITDVDRNSADAVAAAYRTLFLASGGGGLGLFTSIARLRGVHRRIAAPLDAADIPLYAQHADAIDTPTLIDIFREEEKSCLLGTDAVRDGVDVPGPALRLIVFDRVPWPRPDILHKARRRAFGGRAYDEMLTRLRLKQAFGRLVRRESDRGCFVMLDRSMPSRFYAAFPTGVPIERLGLAKAARAVEAFVGPA
ncbi:MAG: ATP-dependent DNA helicase [Alphaproteobacteria bacterium]|nr:ATP-dependent DNA helicase [Alphaproteobacteria bacterium]